jgi:hypothetical protein
LTSKSVNGECEPWVVASRLRDHLLLPRERKDPLLWKKVILKLFWNLRFDCPLLFATIINQIAKDINLVQVIPLVS